MIHDIHQHEYEYEPKYEYGPKYALVHNHENHENDFEMKDLRGFQFEKGKTLEASDFKKGRSQRLLCMKTSQEGFDLKERNPESWVTCEMVPLGNSNPSLANHGFRKANVPHGRLGLRGREAHSSGN